MCFLCLKNVMNERTYLCLFPSKNCTQEKKTKIFTISINMINDRYNEQKKECLQPIIVLTIVKIKPKSKHLQYEPYCFIGILIFIMKH